MTPCSLERWHLPKRFLPVVPTISRERTSNDNSIFFLKEDI